MRGLSFTGVEWFSGIGLILGLPVVILSAATFAAGIAAYIFSSEQKLHWLSLGVFLLLSGTVGTLIYTSGHLGSPFIALWAILTLFAGLYKIGGLVAMAYADAIYIAYLSFTIDDPIAALPSFLFIFAIPLVLSSLIWRHKSFSKQYEKSYTALAHELNQEALKSDIIINAIADGVIVVNSKGAITLINPAAQQIIGWNHKDAIDLDYNLVFRLRNDHDQPIAAEDSPVQHVLRTNESTSQTDLNIITGSGKKIIVSILVSPVGALGEGAIIVFRDITREVVENRQKAEFISTASHEMRTPVAAIEGYLSLALNPQTAQIDQKAREYLIKAHQASVNLGTLFQDLLDVSKAEDGRMTNNPTVVDIITFTGDVVSELAPQAAAKNLQLLYTPSTERNGGATTIQPAFYAYVDAGHLREVLSNLIGNSIKYTRTGSITIGISGDDMHITISIVDTGIGIPQEDIPHLFQKFYRVDNSDTREIGGTGLGLYLCRRIIEAMNGRIWVQSEYGKGSMFFIEIPRLKNDDAVAAAPPQA